MTTRILHILSNLDHMGAAAQSAFLAAGLPRDEFDMHICILGRQRLPNGYLVKNAESLSLIDTRWTPDPTALARLRRLVKRLQPVVVHTWQTPASLYGRIAARLAETRCIVRSEPNPQPRESSLARIVKRPLAARAQRIVVSCDEIRQVCVQRGTPADKLVVIPFAAREPCVAATDRQQVLHELGLPADARLIGTAGPLVPNSRLKDLMWTADLLKVLHDDVHLVIIGDGPQRWRLQRYRRQLHIDDRVHLLGDRPDAGRLISILDLFWIGGQDATQSGAILSAMASAVPVLAANAPASRDVIVPDQSGVLFPVGNRAELARRTKTLLDDPTLAQRIGEAGRHRVRVEFSVDRMVQTFATLYRELRDQ